MLRRVFLMALVALLLVPLAQAQTAPTTALTVTGTPTSVVMAQEDTALVALNLSLEVRNVVCTATATLTVAGTATAAPQSNGTSNATENQTFTAAATPTSLAFQVRAGAYGNNPMLPQAAPYRDTKPVTISIHAVGLTATQNVSVTATFSLPAYAGMDCRGQGNVPAATAPSTFMVSFQATQPVPTSSGPKMPAPPGALLLVILVAGALMRRGRSA